MKIFRSGKSKVKSKKGHYRQDSPRAKGKAAKKAAWRSMSEGHERSGPGTDIR